MKSVKVKIKTRNWVAKHNRHRPVTHRDLTQYQRNQKHKINYAKETSTI